MFKKLLSIDRSSSQLDLASLVLRLIGGGFMLTHGWPKLQKVLAGDFGFADPIGIGASASLVLTVAAEFGGALLLILGLATRLVSIPLMFTMLVAAFLVHGSDPFGKQEFPLLYFVIYLALFFIGSGKFSVDSIFSSNQST